MNANEIPTPDHYVPSTAPRTSDEDHLPEEQGVCHLMKRAGRRIRAASLPEIAGVAATGFALGWLLLSQRRHGRSSDNFFQSLSPEASKRLRQAWEDVRRSELAKSVGQQVSKLATRS
ncbi:hypothetical protein [Luteolibacter marinus]|uniref:hypothetical protein n=1 Tax=Luteolibacter marinus TaxID=2776705 RepID=UPI0018661130|nr:hypothetical protein [Luteolibacter marinus]